MPYIIRDLPYLRNWGKKDEEEAFKLFIKSAEMGSEKQCLRLQLLSSWNICKTKYK